jgi:peptidoglycan hydrolase CwlO-like protein
MVTVNPSRCARLPLVAALLTATLVASLAQPARAGTAEELNAAKRRLGFLQNRIERAERRVARLQDRIVIMAKGLRREEERFERSRLRLIRARLEAEAVRSDLAVIEQRLADRAFSALYAGSATSMELVLEANSWANVMDRMEFLTQLQIADGELVKDVRAKAAELEMHRQGLERMVDAQARRLSRLDAKRQDLLRTLVKQQRALREIVVARKEAERLVDRLRLRLARDFGGASAPFGMWAELFLAKLGAPVCQENLVAVVAWQVAEYTSARWNPLATTLPMPGSWGFNGVGVQNYVSLNQGLEASELTLMRGYSSFGYGPIVVSLRTCADASVTAQAINASLWCRGCAGGGYVTSLIPVVRAYFDRYASIAV